MIAGSDEEVEGKLRTWSESTLFLLRSLLPLMAPVARYEGWSAEERATLSCLLTASARSSESALLLSAYGQLWDAEILMRSVLEGSLKFTYLLQSRSEFPVRHQEYRHDLFRISLLKDHAKAAELLKVLADDGDPAWRPIRDRLLSDEERADFSDRYPKSKRSSLETAWGFTGIIGALSRSDDALFKGFTGFADGYSMASHMLHADHVGTAVPMDIERRSPERRRALLLAHAVRLLSEAMTCLKLRLMVGYRYIDHDYAPVAEASLAMDRLSESFGPVYEDWAAAEYPST